MPHRRPMRTAFAVPLCFMLLAVPILADTTGAEALVGKVTTRAAEQLIGITPALANTPFMGLATLCGLALVADTEWAHHSDNTFARAILRNSLITRMRPYSSGWLLAFLVVVALLVYAANSGKIQGIAGKLAHVIEATTVLGAYVLLSATVLRDLPKLPPQPVAQMSVLPVTSAVLLGTTAIVSLGAMMIVRIALGLAIWLIPIPLVDLLFETFKKFLTLFMIVIYLINPFLAMLMAIGLILLSLFVVRWAWRLMSFVARIIVLPRFGYRSTLQLSERFAVRVSALAVPGFCRRENATLVFAGDEIRLLRGSLGSVPSAVLSTLQNRLVLLRGVWWSELRVVDERDSITSRIAFATAAFDAVQLAAVPLGVAIGHSKLSIWLSPLGGFGERRARTADDGSP